VRSIVTQQPAATKSRFVSADELTLRIRKRSVNEARG